MSRKPEPMTFAGALEVQAQKPLDGRRKAIMLSDLTDAASFPYIFRGLDVFCDEDGKWYTFMGGDQTDINNWRKEGSGDGGETPDWNDITNKPTDLAEAIELTQAQYDALSYEEKHNGKVYFITDGEGGGGSGGGSGIIKLAEAGFVEFENPIAEGEIKSKNVFHSGYNLLPTDLWSVNVTLGAPTTGVDNRWQNQKDGVRLLPVTVTSNGYFRIEVLFEKGFTTAYGGKVPVYYQFYANVKRPNIGTSENFAGGNKQVGDLYTTARAIYNGFLDYAIVLSTTIAKAIERGGHISVSFDSDAMMHTVIGLLDKTRSIVKNPNDGATYYPIVWINPVHEIVNIKYLAIHPTEEDKYTIFFTDAATDNAYQYVDSVDKLLGLYGVDAYDVEVI